MLLVPPPVIIRWQKTASDPLGSVVLNAVKMWLNRPVEDTAWDRETTTLIKVAQQAIEKYCQMSLAPSTWVGTLPQLYDQFRVSIRPFSSIDKIEIVTPTTGAIETVDPSLYQVGPVSQMMGYVQIGNGVSWPDTARRLDAVRVTARTGFFNVQGAPEVPDDIMHALFETVATLDLKRASDGEGGGGLNNTVWGATHTQAPLVLPASAQALLAPYTLRVVTVA